MRIKTFSIKGFLILCLLAGLTILDKSQKTQKYSSATFLKNSRIPTFIDAKHAIAHNKIMIIDRETVVNW